MSVPLRLLLVDDEAPARTRPRDLLGDSGAELPGIVVAEAAGGIAAPTTRFALRSRRWRYGKTCPASNAAASCWSP